jgi:cytochrome b6-f complex iron-sulfur subunit
MEGLFMATEAAPSPEKKAVNRREFLNFVWLVSLGFFTLDLAGVSYLFALPRFREGEFGGQINMGTISELPPPGSSPVNYPKVKLWLSNTETGVMALYKVCTHLGCLFNWREQEGKFVCPCHGSQFQSNGDYIRGPAPRSLDRFVVQAIDPTSNDVIVESTDGTPMPVPENDPNAVIRVDTGKKILGKRHG